MIALLNEKRSEAGCPAVGSDRALAAAAQRHANDMQQNGIRNHIGSDGSTAQQRIAEAGFAGSATGEIVYWSTGGGAHEAAAAWMESPGHRTVIQDCGFTLAGAAEISAGGYVAVVDFGA
ncbi:CAP domain-containing protein [Allorhizocola rhizosphaerae]|uniref:CAP domain-containing protein n=1 Tax=Allorhizocola rhizosphaerae TaxID=1872709 RepID=UPI000E3EA461|nr:CAP domain-containing protein [Allorhizocola rhizosphaerae]